MVVLALIWGWSFLLIKVAVAGMTPTTVAGARIALGAAVLVGTCRARGLSLPRDRESWRHFAVMGLVYSALPFTLLAWGEQRIPSALASVGNATTPLWTAVAAAIALGHRLRRIELIGLGMGLAGVAVAAGLTASDLAGSYVAGALATVGAACSYGVGFTYARRHLGGYPPLVAAAGQLVAASIMMIGPSLATSAISGINPTPTRLAAITVLGIAGTGMAYTLNYGNIAELGPTRASLVTYLVPVVAVTVGIVLLGEAFAARLIIGGGITVAGVALVQSRPQRLNRVRSLPLVGALLAALLIGGCAGRSAPARCGRPVHEALDPRSAVHLLPAAPDPVYLTNPPTSGAHRLIAESNLPVGVIHHALTNGVQVALLEKGGVLIQYQARVASSLSSLLDPLASVRPIVTVAPGTSLPAEIVATAWTWKMTCSSPDADALRTFIRTHIDRGPDSP